MIFGHSGQVWPRTMKIMPFWVSMEEEAFVLGMTITMTEITEHLTFWFDLIAIIFVTMSSFTE